MKKTILLLTILLLFGCKTKEVLVEKIVYKTDSTEIVRINQELIVSTTRVETLEKEITSRKSEYVSVIEKLQLSEREKENLKESLTTIEREYNEKGILIREKFTQKNTELQKDLTRYIEKNKQLQDDLKTELEEKEAIRINYENQVYKISELNKKVNYLEQLNSDLKTVKKTGEFSLKSFLSGIVAGIVLVLLCFLAWKYRGGIKSVIVSLLRLISGV